MPKPYTAQTWADGDITKPVSAARLTTIETGLTNANNTTVVTSFPTSPVDGETCIVRPDPSGAVLWQFRYNNTAGYWEFIGGPPLYNYQSGEIAGSTGVWADIGCNLTMPTLHSTRQMVYTVRCTVGSVSVSDSTAGSYQFALDTKIYSTGVYSSETGIFPYATQFWSPPSPTGADQPVAGSQFMEMANYVPANGIQIHMWAYCNHSQGRWRERKIEVVPYRST